MDKGTLTATKGGVTLNIVWTDSGLFVGPEGHKHKVAHWTPDGYLCRLDTPQANALLANCLRGTLDEMLKATTDMLEADGATIERRG